MYSGKIKVSRNVYEDRRDRLKKLIDLRAPDCIIHAGSRAVAECFENGLWERFNRWKWRRVPHWMWWICSDQYRETSREVDKIEATDCFPEEEI